MVNSFALMSLLNACGSPGSVAEPTLVTNQAKMLRGTVEDWTGEDVVVGAETYNAKDEYVVLAQSAVAADDSFSDNELADFFREIQQHHQQLAERQRTA